MEFSREENFSFWKNLLLSAMFFIVAPLTIAVSLFSLMSLEKTESPKPKAMSGARVYASLPSVFPAIDGTLETGDARPKLVAQYLSNYGSVLVPYADFIVQTADKYNLDYRLITAIAQQESNLCKLIPPSSYNCWGWGIHSQGTLGFSSFEEGIDKVSEGLRREYLDKGFETVDQIMGKYTPLSNGSWAIGVNQFMSEME